MGERGIHFVVRYYGQARGGLGRYEESLYPRLRERIGAHLLRAEALPIPATIDRTARLLGVDLRAVAHNYPCYVRGNPKGIIHLSNQTLGLALLLLHRAKTVVTVHDIAPYVQSTARANRTGNVSFWDWQLYTLGTRCLRRANRIIADSQYTKGDLAKHLAIPPHRVDVVPLGVDTCTFTRRPVPEAIYERYALSAGRRYALYVGSQHPRKNLATLFAAFELLNRSRVQVHLLVVGPRGAAAGPSSPSERACGERDPSVHLLDRVSEEDLVYLYSLADVLVLPSLYEGFGLPVLEAMACGCPVIAANATSLPEVVGDAGMLVEPFAADAWANAIEEVVGNRALRRQMIEAGLEQAKRFSWECTAEATVSVYRGLAS